VPGLQLGYEHSFVHAMVEFVQGLESGKGCRPNFKDGLATDYVVDAVLASAKSRKWQKVKQAM
jgi:myo-inositol 2-dehydrogenase/D-chiro-inositol 1-dehydrogenase